MSDNRAYWIAESRRYTDGVNRARVDLHALRIMEKLADLVGSVDPSILTALSLPPDAGVEEAVKEIGSLLAIIRELHKAIEESDEAGYVTQSLLIARTWTTRSLRKDHPHA